jgi:hypothetical protein
VCVYAGSIESCDDRKLRDIVRRRATDWWPAIGGSLYSRTKESLETDFLKPWDDIAIKTSRLGYQIDILKLHDHLQYILEQIENISDRASPNSSFGTKLETINNFTVNILLVTESLAVECPKNLKIDGSLIKDVTCLLNKCEIFKQRQDPVTEDEVETSIDGLLLLLNEEAWYEDEQEDEQKDEQKDEQEDGTKGGWKHCDTLPFTEKRPTENMSPLRRKRVRQDNSKDL